MSYNIINQSYNKFACINILFLEERNTTLKTMKLQNAEYIHQTRIQTSTPAGKLCMSVLTDCV